MIKWLKNKLSPPSIAAPVIVASKSFLDLFSNYEYGGFDSKDEQDIFYKQFHQKSVMDFLAPQVKAAMDAAPNDPVGFNTFNSGVPQVLLRWYGTQSFIGYQMCTILAQHWLINKACKMPGDDAIRNGYEINRIDGKEITPEINDQIMRLNIKYNLATHLINFVYKSRVFGVRIALFVIDSPDPDYYKKPFNPDGVRPGSYKGICQIDPVWVAPQLDQDAAANPMSLYFYEPTWWNINGQQVHRTHLIITRQSEVMDTLKPTYFFGGVPLPQKLYERVYAAERTANEAPELAMTKRMTILNTDMTKVAANQANFERQMQLWAKYRDNFGVKIVGEKEQVQQLETSLADLDTVIMTQYQLVAAIANVPATKLLGTQPKGFNTTGEFEEASYHEELESIQTHVLTPLLERHLMLLIRSEIKGAPFEISIEWRPLDALTAEEQATLNKAKADTGAVLMQSGAIDGQDERNRIIADPASGYSGLEAEIEESAETEGDLSE